MSKSVCRRVGAPLVSAVNRRYQQGEGARGRAVATHRHGFDAVPAFDSPRRQGRTNLVVVGKCREQSCLVHVQR